MQFPISPVPGEHLTQLKRLYFQINPGRRSGLGAACCGETEWPGCRFALGCPPIGALETVRAAGRDDLLDTDGPLPSMGGWRMGTAQHGSAHHPSRRLAPSRIPIIVGGTPCGLWSQLLPASPDISQELWVVPARVGRLWHRTVVT